MDGELVERRCLVLRTCSFWRTYWNSHHVHNNYIEGCLVPDNIMIRMVMGDAVEAIKNGQSLLLDGFPRTMEQAVALDKSLDVDMVINLCIPNETIIERISDRYVPSAIPSP